MGVCKGGGRALEFQKGSKVNQLLAAKARGLGRGRGRVLSILPSGTLNKLPQASGKARGWAKARGCLKQRKLHGDREREPLVLLVGPFYQLTGPGLHPCTRQSNTSGCPWTDLLAGGSGLGGLLGLVPQEGAEALCGRETHTGDRPHHPWGHESTGFFSSERWGDRQCRDGVAGSKS